MTLAQRIILSQALANLHGTDRVAVIGEPAPVPSPAPAPKASVCETSPDRCSCGRKISRNKKYCLDCIEQLEYVALLMQKAQSKERFADGALVRLSELHARFGTADHREQTISFTYGNVRLHNPAVTREMVAAQFDKLFETI